MGCAEPVLFWSVYKEILRARDSWDKYASNTLWTKVTVDAADEACKQIGNQADSTFYTSREYFKIDLIAYARRENQNGRFKGHNWDLKVAFEHENKDDWEDELCKLTHIAADLCVIVFYTKDFDPKPKLEEAVEVMGDRMTRVKNRKWLFIAGPRCCCANKPFVAYTLNSNGSVEPIGENRDDALTPATSWRDAT